MDKNSHKLVIVPCSLDKRWAKPWTKHRFGQMLDKLWTSTIIGQILDNYYNHQLNFIFGQELDKRWTFSCPIFVHCLIIWTKLTNEAKYWTKIGLLFDKNLTSVQVFGKTWTRLGHRQILDKHLTKLGQILDICPKFVQYLSNHPFYESTHLPTYYHRTGTEAYLL